MVGNGFEIFFAYEIELVPVHFRAREGIYSLRDLLVRERCLKLKNEHLKNA